MVLASGKVTKKLRSHDPHLIVPFRLQGDGMDLNDEGLHLDLKVSFRALILVGVLLNVVSVPISDLIVRFV